MKNISSDKKRVDMICFGGEDWWYKNRGHIDMQLMRRFARIGTVLYVNSIVMQKPNLAKCTGGGKSFMHKLVRKTKSIMKGLRKSEFGFWVYSPLSLPVHHIAWLRNVNNGILRAQLWVVTRILRMHKPVVWVACPAACDVGIKMKKAKLVYQRTDRYEEYPNVDADVIEQYDRRLKANAELTVFVSRVLYEQERTRCNRAVFLDHGVDFDMFSTAELEQEKPADMAEIKRPIVGFFGGIDNHTFDVGFVEKVIDMLPQMSFVFVGSASSDCSGLAARSNVRMLGQKSYEQIPHYGKCFDVAIMPWRQNRWIEACNPVKLKEYLALGKPVVSVPFNELKNYCDVVYEAGTPAEFADCIRKALSENGPELVAKRKQKVAQASWDSKAELVLQELYGENSKLAD
ncbi:MAG: glycosyltransferase [Phycisphaerae bacterium]|nr:glycosyltransferase [Phycisphaerae bacterium]